jgi:hypothetical protein
VKFNLEASVNNLNFGVSVSLGHQRRADEIDVRLWPTLRIILYVNGSWTRDETKHGHAIIAGHLLSGSIQTYKENYE